nr:glycosyltransferase family 39 protein [Pseudonocardia endophytica]
MSEWVALAVLLVGTGALYLWNLGASGWANSFYAAAVQAGTQNWTAFFFGSLDAGNAITVDKPPASLWPMEIAGRIFGFSSWSMLVPQALMGVATVALLYAAVRRAAGPGAGLIAGALMALTPVAALMFRFNNPDALLVLLMVAAAYCTVRAAERGSTRWILLAGLVIGFAFLAKSLQAFLVLPGLALAYLWAAPGSVRRRVVQLLGSGIAIVVGAGWWLLAVALWPVSSRPYIGGSGDNTPLGLAFGYNGLGRIFGDERGGPGAGGGLGDMPGDAAGGALPGGATGGALPGGTGGFPGGMPPGGAGGGGGPGGMFGGQAGLLRMFGESFATQVSWLLPAALVLLVASLWFTRRAVRTDRTRAALLAWGGWTVVTVLVFSFMSGIIHPYYTVALAPGIAATVAIGGAVLLRNRDTWLARIVLAVTAAGTAVWAFVLLGWSPEFLPWLRWVVLVLGVLAGAAFLLPAGRRRWAAVVAGAAVLAGVTAPAAYAAQTSVTPHTGSIPTAGPTVAGAQGGFGGMRDGRRDRADRGANGTADGTGTTPGAVPGAAGTDPGSATGTAPGSGTGSAPGATPGDATGTAPGDPAGSVPGDATGSAPGDPAGSTPGDAAGTAPGDATGTAPDDATGTAPGDPAGGTTPGAAGANGAGLPGGAAAMGGFGGPGGMGGPGEETTDPALASLLRNAQATGVRWAAATIGAMGAGPMELSSGASVMAIGGFSGSDESPTLQQFQAYVHDGQIRYFVSGGMRGGGPGGDRGVGKEITDWVAAHYTATTVGGQTVYDLSAPAH